MPAKKKATKKTKSTVSVQTETNLIAMQGILLAIIAGVVLYGILKMVQLRDEVDLMIMQQLAQPTTQQPVVTETP